MSKHRCSWKMSFLGRGRNGSRACVPTDEAVYLQISIARICSIARDWRAWTMLLFVNVFKLDCKSSTVRCDYIPLVVNTYDDYGNRKGHDEPCFKIPLPWLLAFSPYLA